jgi:NitT/TauT family transport system permease protein
MIRRAIRILFPKGYSFLRPEALALFVGLWEVAAWLSPDWPSLIGAVLPVLWSDVQDPAFREALGGSARRMVLGYSLVMVIGVAGGALLGRVPLVDQLLGSIAVAIHAIPGAAWVPLAIIWFGMTERAVIFTVLLGAAGIVMVETDAGVREVPPAILRAARTMGARGVKRFVFVEVPAATPKIVGGLRLAWAFGWRALMAGELLTSVSGLGQQLSTVAKAGQLDRLLALMLLIAFIGILVDGLIFKRLEHEVRVRWGLA